MSSTFNFISKYLISTLQNKNGRRDFCIGATSTILIVFFISFLIAAIYDSNFLFLKIAENSASEADFIFIPRPTNRFTSPFLNFTAFTEVLRNKSDPLLEVDGGTSARWLAVAELINTQDPSKSTTTTVLVVDTARETQVKMGRIFNKQYRKLGKQEAYFSSTICAAIGVPPNKGQRITMKMDLVELAGSLLGNEVVVLDDGSSISLADALKDPAKLKLFLGQSLGIDFSQNVIVPTSQITNDVLTQQAGVARSTGDPNAQLIAGLLAVAAPLIPATVTVTLSTIFDALYPTLVQTLQIEEEFIALQEITTPNGKYPNGIGNVMLMEIDDAERLVRNIFLQLKELLDPTVLPLREQSFNTTNQTEIEAINQNPLVVAYDSLVLATVIGKSKTTTVCKCNWTTIR